uniref:protein GAMETE EXPRESSED 1-like n=1 Tax=Erigeron canadensis TaxID=72917 RepID=UPI001CB9B0EF|nr:protein GAMETE EXPRESSED 1-like [Erigeron canadensis]
MSHMKCSSVGMLLVLVLLSYSCSFAFGGEVGYSKEEITSSEKVNASSCLKSVYDSIAIGCSEILGEEGRSRLAWNLTDCVWKDKRDQLFPYCDVKSPMKDCVKKLDDDAHMMYLEFYRQTNDICLLLQDGAEFIREMEVMVKELKRQAMQSEQMIVEIDSKQQELIELEEQLNKVQEELEQLNKVQEMLELILESVPFDVDKLYTLYKAHLQKLRVIATFVIILLIYFFCY